MGWVTIDGAHVYIKENGEKAFGASAWTAQAQEQRRAKLKASASDKIVKDLRNTGQKTPAPSHANPHVAAAIDKARAAGIRTHVLTGHEAIKRWGIKFDHVHASYDHKLDVILINAAHPHWKDPAASAAKHAGWFSTTEPTHTIEHEMAHREHRQAIGAEAFGAMAKSKEPPMAADKIAQHVGRYASKLKVELVAEMRVGMLHGKQYHPRLVEYYKSLGGVT